MMIFFNRRASVVFLGILLSFGVSGSRLERFTNIVFGREQNENEFNANESTRASPHAHCYGASTWSW